MTRLEMVVTRIHLVVPLLFPEKLAKHFRLVRRATMFQLHQINITTSGGKTLTLSAWINWNGYTGNTDLGCIIRKCYTGYTDASPWQSYSMEIGKSNGSVQLTIDGVGGVVAPTGTITANQWYHVVGTYDGSNLKIYVNGVLKNTTAATNTIPQYSGPLVIGGASEVGNNNGFKGMLDEVKIWNVALTEGQVIAVYNQIS